MKIRKESTVLSAGRGSSKQTTLPPIICELLRIEVGDKLEWVLDGADENPEIIVRLVKKDYE